MTGVETTAHTELWAFERGYIHKDEDDLSQIRYNKYVVDGNDDYWLLLINDKYISIKRTNKHTSCILKT
jgi:hypothetical protein